MKGILNRLRKIRKSSKTSVKAASSNLGVSAGTYYAWEEGIKPIPIKYIVPLCHMFNVDANYIFGTKPRVVDENIISLYRTLDDCSQQIAYALLTSKRRKEILRFTGVSILLHPRSYKRMMRDFVTVIIVMPLTMVWLIMI